MSRLSRLMPRGLMILGAVAVALSNMGFGGCCDGAGGNSYGFSWSWGGNSIA